MNKIKLQLKKLPDAPGVYRFYNSKKELIYIGKATSLKSRVQSYFTGSPTSRPIEQMIDEVKKINWKKTDSVIEAIILEGNDIKKFRPKYNIDWRDDKSWNYLVITDEKFPRLKTLREHELTDITLSIPSGVIPRRDAPRRVSTKSTSKLFGPYPGLNTAATLKLLRRLFYVSTCQPPRVDPARADNKSNQKRPCFYHQLGQCLGVCIGEISAADYQKKVIKPLMAFLSGKKKPLIKNLRCQMLLASRAQNFEEAARLRNQIKSLQRIQDIALLNKSFFEKKIGHWSLGFGVSRIEAYDVSNLGAEGKVGAMMVFDESGPIKSEYKKFKIKTVVGQSDVDCLKEVLDRRFNHPEWPRPEMILVDGGRPQVNAARQILRQKKINLPILGIAKGPARKKNDFIFDPEKQDFVRWVWRHDTLLIRARDATHRFAVSYQRQLRKIK